MTDSRIYKKQLLKHSEKAEAKAREKANLQYARNVKFFVRMVLDHFIAEITKEYSEKGKNVHDSRTKSSIDYWAKKRIVDAFGVNPDNILSTSPKKLVEVLYRTRTPKEPKLVRDRWDDEDVLNIFTVPDDELGPIGRDIIHEPQKWISTKTMIDNYHREIRSKEFSRRLSEEEETCKDQNRRLP